MTIFEPAERWARIASELRLGFCISLQKNTSRYAFVLSAERAQDRWVNILRNITKQPYLVLSKPRASTLQIPVYDGDFARILPPDNLTASTLNAIADPSRDMENPMKGPFSPLRGGDLDAARAGLRLMQVSGLLQAAVIAETAGDGSGEYPDVLEMDIELALATPPGREIKHVVTAQLPIAGAAESRVHVFREGATGDEHLALEIGTASNGAVDVVRVHSSCYTGDVLGSLRCDCGPQLEEAIASITKAGNGVLVILQQEGRGIGLANKMRAYKLQDEGFDTYEANRRLGFEEDPRDFQLAGMILKALGCKKIGQLLSSNTAKCEALEFEGLVVEQVVSQEAEENLHNTAYLSAKRERQKNQT